MELYYKTFGEGKPLIILHGLFGSSDNWLTHAKKLADYFKVYLVDQRNHGHSPWSDAFSYQIMADDLHELVKKEQLADFILMGHSMGGKTAMLYTQQHEELVEKLIVVDMGVKEYPIHHDTILEGLNSLDLSVIDTRSRAEEELGKYIENLSIRQFLLKNLYWKEKGQLAWRINITVLEKEMPSIVGALPYKEVFTETLFMRGGQSNYIREEDEDHILKYFPISEIHTIERAGHWIHAEAPEEFIEEVLGFCVR
jgi:pimeloyl-ACP methyl ester carboxylesterase